jgi:hypothetical protein
MMTHIPWEICPGLKAWNYGGKLFAGFYQSPLYIYIYIYIYIMYNAQMHGKNEEARMA